MNTLKDKIIHRLLRFNVFCIKSHYSVLSSSVSAVFPFNVNIPLTFIGAGLLDVDPCLQKDFHVVDVLLVTVGAGRQVYGMFSMGVGDVERQASLQKFLDYACLERMIIYSRDSNREAFIKKKE